MLYYIDKLILCKCGAQCQDNTKFCPKCGDILTPATSQSNGAANNTQSTYTNGSNTQGYTQPNSYTNPQGTYQNGPCTNPQDDFQNGMPTMGQNPFKAKKNISIFGIVSGALLVLSMFLPFITASLWGETFSEPLIKGGFEAYLFVALGIGAIILSILGQEKVVLSIGGVSCILSIYEIIKFSKQIDKNGLGGIAHRGIGFWLMIIASIVIVAAVPINNLITKKKTV